MVTPESFGAVGDGQTNDTYAFNLMTRYINRQGGGTIVFSPKTYVVGGQSYNRRMGYAYWPDPIMDFSGCSKPLAIVGNGARIRCADGLRFGTFDASTGEATQHPMPYYGTGELSSPYFAMISIEDCSNTVEISDVELDGNIAGLKIGGPWGDTGWQIGCTGLRLVNNHAPITVTNVRSHHHCQDGGCGDGPGIPGALESVTIQDCQFSDNGRNGWSHVGGVGWTFQRCTFERSARSLPFPGSAPKAGIDFEAEGGKYIAQVAMVDCISQANAGAACLHPGSMRTSDVTWVGGRIVGTDFHSYYGGGNDGIRFSNALFLGALVNLSKEVFEDCTFSDDVSQSPTGSLFNPYGFIIPDSVATNRFTRCEIVHTTKIGSQNGNWDGALFENCIFRSSPGSGRLDVYGHFKGSDTHFVAESGGSNFLVTPDALGGVKSAGHADDPFKITTNDGVTTVYTPA